MRVGLVLLSLLVVPAAACGGGGGGSDAGGDASDVRDIPDVAPDGETTTDEGDVPADEGDVSMDDGDVLTDEGDVSTDEGDVSTDEGDVTDSGRTKQTVITVTAGGGTVRNDRYQLTLGVGVPQPMGSGTSGAHAGQLGPGAVLNQ